MILVTTSPISMPAPCLEARRERVGRRGGEGWDTPTNSLKTICDACSLLAWVWGRWWERQFLLPILLYHLYFYQVCVYFHNKVCLHIEIIVII